MEISVGDYVLTGGEIPSMILIDSITRLIDGVITKESHENDSFQENLLDYPVYTHPVEFMGMKVPEVLLSGHHKNIASYRKEQQEIRTKERRPDLLEKRNYDE
jgi:tRNA (guanine37-N1)-methyltransferase